MWLHHTIFTQYIAILQTNTNGVCTLKANLIICASSLDYIQSQCKDANRRAIARGDANDDLPRKLKFAWRIIAQANQ